MSPLSPLPTPEMIKMIAVDLDGTLLDSQKNLPPHFADLVRQLQQRGIQLVIASGRQHYNLLKKFPDLAPQLIFISENGAMVGTAEQFLQIDAVPPEIVKKSVELIRQAGGSPVICGSQGAFLELDNAEFFRNAQLYYEKLAVVPDVLAHLGDDKVCKVAAYAPGAETQLLPALSVLRPNFSVTLSGWDWVDVMNCHVNKGSAIKFVQHYLGVTPEQSMAFGDYLNDRELLQNCYWSFAMANAHPDLKAISHFECPSNDEHGVVKTWRQYFHLT